MRLDPAIYDIPDALSNAEMCRRSRRKHKIPVEIAVLDLETDPFDHENLADIRPFLAVLYTGEHSSPLVIWDENWTRLMASVRDAIVSLPGRFIVYAHNGGRFDFLYLLREMRGEVLFKGRSLMSARIGEHELRDSFHIIPEALKNANRKTEIDYSLFTKGRRNAHRKEITEYCIDDCKSLYEIVTTFKDEFGTPLTIGQAAMSELKKKYTFDRLSPATDLYFRNWFFGGRVECLKTGIYDPTKYFLYDVNSMYPYVMAKYPHPVTGSFAINDRLRAETMFLTIRCKNNGALVGRDQFGNLTTQIKEGIFNTTIWEYEVAVKHGLIRDIEIIKTIEFDRCTNFAEFVNPLYEGRQQSKRLQAEAEKAGDTFAARNYARDVLFRKLLLNNAYGKFAQNPRRFSQHYITEPMERPGDGDPTVDDWGELPSVETDAYWIWCKPTDDLRFNNVASAASITGAARSVLLDALASCVDPVYCDTDSIICTRLGEQQPIDALELGAWDIEAPVSAFIGNGKKLYAYRRPDREPPKNTIIKAKGMNGVTWEDMIQIANGAVISKTMRAPTLNKDGTQQYLSRNLRATI
jgi:hypothetical protein